MEQPQETAEQPQAKPILEDTRVDEFALGQFKAMGYESLSDTLVLVYREFKRRKDRIYPGRLTPEGFAIVATLTDMIEGRLKVL